MNMNFLNINKMIKVFLFLFVLFFSFLEGSFVEAAYFCGEGPFSNFQCMTAQASNEQHRFNVSQLICKIQGEHCVTSKNPSNNPTCSSQGYTSPSQINEKWVSTIVSGSCFVALDGYLCCQKNNANTNLECEISGSPGELIDFKLAEKCLKDSNNCSSNIDFSQCQSVSSDPAHVCCFRKPENNEGSSGSAESGSAPASAPAQTFSLYNPLGTTSIPVIIGRVIKIILGVVGSLALVAFIYGGGMYMISRGDSGTAKKGKDAMVNAVIGLFIILLSYIITSTILKSLAGPMPIVSTVDKTVFPADKETKADRDQTNLKQQEEEANEPISQSRGGLPPPMQ